MQQFSGKLNTKKMDNNQQKNASPFTICIVLFLSFLFNSCDLVEGIFKAGMGFGIFIVLAVVVAIVAIIIKLGKK